MQKESASPSIPGSATSTFGGVVLNLPDEVKIMYPPRRMRNQLTTESINFYQLSKRDVNNVNKDITYHKFDHIAQNKELAPLSKRQTQLKHIYNHSTLKKNNV